MSRPSSTGVLIFAGLGATAALVLGALALVALVLAKGDRLSEASLDVDVQGVPGYVYVGKPYDITVEYKNSGAQATGPARVVIDLSGEHDFVVTDASDGGLVGVNHVEWALVDVDGKSSGKLQMTVVAQKAKDYGKADYNFPGYAGHAAFDDGFHLTARIERVADANLLASAAVVADTGFFLSCNQFVATPCVEVVKVNSGNSTDSFEFSATNLPGTTFFNLANGESQFIHYEPCPNGGCPNILIQELDDSDLVDVQCQANDVFVVESNPVEIRPDSFTGAMVLCFFFNVRDETPNVGGVFPAIFGPRATPTRVPAAGAAPAAGTLGAPRTGDGGLAD